MFEPLPVIFASDPHPCPSPWKGEGFTVDTPHAILTGIHIHPRISQALATRERASRYAAMR